MRRPFGAANRHTRTKATALTCDSLVSITYGAGVGLEPLLLRENLNLKVPGKVPGYPQNRMLVKSLEGCSADFTAFLNAGADPCTCARAAVNGALFRNRFVYGYSLLRQLTRDRLVVYVKKGSGRRATGATIRNYGSFYLPDERWIFNRVAFDQARTKGGRANVTALLVQLDGRYGRELEKELASASI